MNRGEGPSASVLHSMATTRAPVSVVIPAYNHERYVGEAIESALAQGDLVGEVVVVDDGSQDATTPAALAVRDHRVRVITQPNAGPSASRNVGWRAARGEWIFLLDADDTLAPRALGRLLGEIDMASGVIPYGYQEVYADDFGHAAAFTAHLSQRTGDLLEDVAVNYLATIFVSLIPRRHLEVIGGLDERVRYGEDLDLALRLAKRFHFQYVNVPVYRARMHGANRHRSFPEEGYRQYVDLVRRAFADERRPGRWVIGRRALAHQHWIRGAALDAAGDRAGARVAFGRSWRSWPFKAGAWKRWLATLRGA